MAHVERRGAGDCLVATTWVKVPFHIPTLFIAGSCTNPPLSHNHIPQSHLYLTSHIPTLARRLHPHSLHKSNISRCPTIAATHDRTPLQSAPQLTPTTYRGRESWIFSTPALPVCYMRP